jgi:hypothetical protein
MFFPRILCHFKFAIYQFLASLLCVVYVHYEAEAAFGLWSQVQKREATEGTAPDIAIIVTGNRQSRNPRLRSPCLGSPWVLHTNMTLRVPSYALSFILVWESLLLDAHFRQGPQGPHRPTDSFMFAFLLSSSEIVLCNSPFSKIRVYRPWRN